MAPEKFNEADGCVKGNSKKAQYDNLLIYLQMANRMTAPWKQTEILPIMQL